MTRRVQPFAAVIVAAGQGKRLGELGARYSKPMVPVAGRPLIDWSIERLQRAGADHIVVVVHPANQLLRDHLASSHPEVDVVSQTERLGIADAVEHAIPALRGVDGFLSCACDSLFRVSEMSELVARGQGAPGAAVVGVLDMGVEATRTRSAVEVAADRVVSIEEKPAHPRSSLVALPLYWLPGTIAPRLAQATAIKGERHVTSALADLIDCGGDVLALTLSERLEITAPEDIATVEQRLSFADPTDR